MVYCILQEKCSTDKQIESRIVEEPLKVLQLEQDFVWTRNMDIMKEGEQKPGKL